MTRSYSWISFVCVIVISIPSAFGQQIVCGTPPQLSPLLQNNESIKGDLQGKAQFLSKFIGQAQLGGQIEAAKKEIYVQSKEYYPAQQIAYLSYLFCEILRSDTQLTTQQKLDALAKFTAVRPQGANEPPACSPAVLKTIMLPDMPTLDGNNSHVGNLSGISLSIIQECLTPNEAKYRYHLDYDYYNGSGTWRGEEHLILVIKSSDGAILKTATFPLDRSRCIYGHAEHRGAEGVLEDGTGILVNSADLSVSRVSGTQTGC